MYFKIHTSVSGLSELDNKTYDKWLKKTCIYKLVNFSQDWRPNGMDLNPDPLTVGPNRINIPNHWAALRVWWPEGPTFNQATSAWASFKIRKIVFHQESTLRINKFEDYSMTSLSWIIFDSSTSFKRKWIDDLWQKWSAVE